MEPLLERTLELAERGRGTTRPNPVVGAVIANGGKVVGEGWHREAGGPHAEVVALATAGARARGATLYVSLEPCAHHGRTPPCVDAIVAAGVARVVAASSDPGAASGGGLGRLAAAGVEAVLEDTFAARAQNEAWRAWARDRRPFVTYKVAATLDGRVTVPGRRWVTGEESRRRVHLLRAASDAVAVGHGHGAGRRSAPRRAGRGGSAPATPPRLRQRASARRVVSSSCALARFMTSWLRSPRRACSRCSSRAGRRSRPPSWHEGLVDKLLVFLAPTLSGEGPTLLGSLAEPLDLLHTTVERVGDDLLVSAYVREP